MAPDLTNIPNAPALLLIAEWALCILVYAYTVAKFTKRKTWSA